MQKINYVIEKMKHIAYDNFGALSEKMQKAENKINAMSAKQTEKINEEQLTPADKVITTIVLTISFALMAFLAGVCVSTIINIVNLI